MKKLITFLIGLSIGLFAYSQSFAPDVVSSGGDIMTNATVSFSYTLGEILTETGTNNNIKWTQGFQQPFPPNCTNPTNGGTISASQSICPGDVPAAFTSTTEASGHTGTVEYKWQQSTTGAGAGFTDIANSNSATYAPGALTVDTWYKRLARVDCMADWASAVESNVVSVSINSLDDAGFSYSSPAFCLYDSDPTPSITGLQGGTFSGADPIFFDPVTGTFLLTLTIPGTYQVTYTTNGTCPNTSTETVIIADPQISFPPSPIFTMHPETITLTPGAFDTYLWQDNSTLSIYDVQDFGTYELTVTQHGCQDMASIDILEVQDIPLRQGWGIFSSYINTSLSFDAIVSGLASNNMVFFKNVSGLVYTNLTGQTVDQIVTYTIGEGYQYRMWNPGLVLTIVGPAVDPSVTTLSLNNGYNLLGYLRKAPAPVVQIMAPIASNILIMKDEDGKVYWNVPQLGGWINQIGNMMPGMAYQLKLNAAVNFTYPANPIPFSKSDIFIEEPSYYKPPTATGSNMTLGIPETAWDIALSNRDEIGVFNSNGELVGSGVYEGSHVAIALWGNDELNKERVGLGADEAFTLQLWNSQTGNAQELVVTEWAEGDGSYGENEIAIVGKLAVVEESDLSLNSYPNPFSDVTTIAFHIPEDGNVRIELFSSIGERVEVIVDCSFEAGTHELLFNVGELAVGTYFIRLETNGHTVNKAVQVVK